MLTSGAWSEESLPDSQSECGTKGETNVPLPHPAEGEGGLSG